MSTKIKTADLVNELLNKSLIVNVKFKTEENEIESKIYELEKQLASLKEKHTQENIASRMLKDAAKMLTNKKRIYVTEEQISSINEMLENPLNYVKKNDYK